MAAVGLLRGGTAAGEGKQSVENSAFATNAPAGPRAEAEKLARSFPSLYWHVADACMRETTRHGFGMSQSHDEFVKEMKAVVEKVEMPERGADKSYKICLRLQNPDKPDEYWLLELANRQETWEAETGYKYMDGKRVFDLFEDEYVFGVKAMGSMKPYFQKAFKAYSEGKDIGSVFKKK